MMTRYSDVFSFGALHRAFRKARRAKRGRGDEPRFYRDLEIELLALSDALQARIFEPDDYRYFNLRKSKSRLVAEASFRDRVVHHALVAAQEPAFEPSFIEHSYACQRGRGSHAAVKQIEMLCRHHRYGLRLDVEKYFEHIKHDTLLALLDARCDEGTRWLCRVLIEHAQVPTVPQGERRGLPIGNLTSQFWANVYLDGLDHFVTRTLGQWTYARYMDDVVVFGSDKRVLWEVAEAVGDFLAEHRGLRLHRTITRVLPVSEGIPWLGMRVFPGLTRIANKGKYRFIRKLRASVEAARDVSAQETERDRSTSLCGHLRQADTLQLRRSVLNGLLSEGLDP